MPWALFRSEQCLANQLSQDLAVVRGISAWRQGTDIAHLKGDVAHGVVEVCTGAVAWWASCAVTQLSLKALGIAASHRVLASAFGVVGMVAGTAGAVFSTATVSKLQQTAPRDLETRVRQLPSAAASVAADLRKAWRTSKSDCLETLVLETATSLTAFRLLNGRLWSLAPSDIRYVGAFGRVSTSLPATESYATPVQSALLQNIGRKLGCHTCGHKGIFSARRFHGDHQPPKYIAAQLNDAWWRRWLGWKVPFRFYPQCNICSSAQGPLVKHGCVFRVVVCSALLFRRSPRQSCSIYSCR